MSDSLARPQVGHHNWIIRSLVEASIYSNLIEVSSI